MSYKFSWLLTLTKRRTQPELHHSACHEKRQRGDPFGKLGKRRNRNQLDELMLTILKQVEQHFLYSLILETVSWEPPETDFKMAMK